MKTAMNKSTCEQNGAGFSPNFAQFGHTKEAGFVQPSVEHFPIGAAEFGSDPGLAALFVAMPT